MKNDPREPLLSLTPELLAEVRQALREGESVSGFVETAVRQQLAQRQGAPRTRTPAASDEAPAGGRHVADELLTQLDGWLKAARTRPEAAALSPAGAGSPSR